MAEEHNTKQGLQKQLVDLEQQKYLVSKLINLVGSIEDLRNRLSIAMTQTHLGVELPLDLIERYNLISERLQKQSENKILAIIKQRDAQLHTLLHNVMTVMAFQEWQFFREEAADKEEGLRNTLDDVVRCFNDALALRVLCEKRFGKRVPLPELDENQQLREQLRHLEEVELEGKKSVADDIKTLRNELAEIIKQPGISERMKAHIEKARDDLKEAFRHLLAGKSIRSLPVDLDRMDLSSTPAEAPEEEWVVTELPAEPAPGTDIEAATRNSETADISDNPNDQDSPSQSSSAPGEAPTATQRTKAGQSIKDRSQQNDTEPAGAAHKTGFFGRLWLWLNTPWGTRWKDLDKQNKPRKKS